MGFEPSDEMAQAIAKTKAVTVGAAPEDEIAAAGRKQAELDAEAAREAHSIVARAKHRVAHDMAVWSAKEAVVVRKIMELVKMVHDGEGPRD